MHNLLVIGISREEKMAGRNICEKIMAKYFLKLMNDINLQILGAQ